MATRHPNHEYPPPWSILPFEAWLEAKFSGDEKRVAEVQGEERYHHETLAAYAEYHFWIWENPTEWLLDRFSFNQIGMGLWQDWHPYMDDKVPRELRNRGWEALRILFRDLFMPSVSDCLAILNESSPETNKLNGACYMWWDVCPYYSTSPRIEPVDTEYFLAICRDCLFSDRPAIQESAIHGLGEAIPWGGEFKPAQDMLEEFILSGSARRPELLEYAQRAKTGCIP